MLERMEPRQLLAVFQVTNNGDAGNGTLRNAIAAANTSSGNDTIQFNLPANQLVIKPLTALPALSDSGTTLDAVSKQQGYNGTPIVTIDGSNLPGGSTALTVSGGNCVVDGLVIQNFPGAGGTGILLNAAGADTVENCFIGTVVSGTASGNIGGDGIDVLNPSDTIGGTSAATRNVISGNGGNGILVGGGGTSGNVIIGNFIGVGSDGSTPLGNGIDGIFVNGASHVQIGGVAAGAGNVVSGNPVGVELLNSGPSNSTVQGNLIGTDATGSIAIPNTKQGILINNAGKNTIGGGTAGAGNTISGNGTVGVEVDGAAAAGNLIQGNFIGTQANGTSPLGNTGDGIAVNGPSGMLVGGQSSQFGNTIAFNGGGSSGGFGVDVIAGTSIQILTNSIYANTSGGIFLSNGSNNNLAPPTLTLAQTAANQTIVDGSFSGMADSIYTIQFFTVPTADPSNQGQGETFVGQVTITTDLAGNGTFSADLPQNTNVGDFMTATLTESSTANTSEFADDVQITPAPVANLSVSISPDPSPVDLGGTETYTITVTNNGPDPATNVVLTSVIDNNSTYVEGTVKSSVGAAPTFNGNTLTADIGSLSNTPGFNTATITFFEVTPNAVGTISNTATVTEDQINSNPNAATQTVNVTVNPAASLDLSVATNPVGPTVPNGQPLTYVVTVQNVGPSVATNVLITDMLPTGATLTQNPVGSNGVVTVSADKSTVTDMLATLGVLGIETLTFTVTPTQAGTLTNTATVTEDTDDPDPSPSTGSVTTTTTVENAVDLGVTYVANPNPATVGADLTYVLTITNSGPDPATAATLTDTLPSGVNYISSSSTSGTATQTNGVVSVSFGTIAAGGIETVTIIVQPTAAGSLTNTATVADPNEFDTDKSNDTATTPVVLVSPADLSVALTGTPEPIALGGTLTYTVVVTNNGPAGSAPSTLTDMLPGGVTVDSITGSSGVTTPASGTSQPPGEVTAAIEALSPGQSVTLTIVVTPQAPGSFTDTATVAGGFDPDLSNNTATTTNLVNPVDVAVAISPSVSSVLVGSDVTYTFVIANGGPLAATNVAFSASLPSSVTVVSLSSSVGTAIASGDTISLTIPSLAANGTATVTVTVQAGATGTLTTTATVAAPGDFDTNPANNTATNTITATNLPGTIELSSAVYAGAENAGFVTITLDRTNGTEGPAVLDYSTLDGTAVAGVNYGFASGSIAFADGQTTATVNIPLIDDGQVTPNLEFTFELTGVQSGSATIGSPSSATVIVVNTDRDLTPPVVTAITPVFTGPGITAVVLSFSKPLNESNATIAQNYGFILSAGQHASGSPLIAVAFAEYNSTTNQVVLFPSRPLALNTFYNVVINAASPSGVDDLSGNFLAGNGGAGTNFDDSFALGSNLSYIDAGLNEVNLALKGGDMILTRFANGEADQLELLGTTSGFSHITGSVTKLSKSFSSGFTVVAQVSGFGAFGSVNSSLTTPPFFVIAGGFTTGTSTASSTTSLTASTPAINAEAIAFTEAMAVTPAELIGVTIPGGPIKKKK